MISRSIALNVLHRYGKLTDKNLQRTKDTLENSPNHDRSLVLLLNCQEIILINTYDLLILSYNYLKSKNSWQKTLYIRLMVVCMIDFLDKVYSVIDREMLDECEKFSNSCVMQKLKNTLKCIGSFNKIKGPELREIRNNSIAHKMKEGNQLYNYIIKIDHKKIYKYSDELVLLLTRLHEDLNDNLRMYLKK